MKKYDFELEETLKWSNAIKKQMEDLNLITTKSMRRNDIYESLGYAFGKLEEIKWSNYFCKTCANRLAPGQKRLCYTCRDKETQVEDSQVYYGCGEFPIANGKLK